MPQRDVPCLLLRYRCPNPTPRSARTDSRRVRLAVRFVPEAIGNVFSAFKGDDEEDNRALLLMLAVVLVAVGAGVMTARAIILATARKSSQTVLSELQTQHAAT
jgi:hypothetical protein